MVNCKQIVTSLEVILTAGLGLWRCGGVEAAHGPVPDIGNILPSVRLSGRIKSACAYLGGRGRVRPVDLELTDRELWLADTHTLQALCRWLLKRYKTLTDEERALYNRAQRVIDARVRL